MIPLAAASLDPSKDNLFSHKTPPPSSIQLTQITSRAIERNPQSGKQIGKGSQADVAEAVLFCRDGSNRDSVFFQWMICWLISATA